jgi:general secretion pathway protein D
LKYAGAADVEKALTSVFQQQKGDIAPRRFVADARTNALIVMATESDTERIKELIDMMDQGVDKGALNVYKLQNAWAEDLAKVLMNLPKTTTGTAPAGGAPVLSKNVQIIADKATNTLVISADRADYAILESIIKQLDANRPMVYIEALIMEVAVTKNFRLGVEWQGMHDFSYSGNKGGVVGGFSGDNYGNTAGVISSTIPALPQGMSLGVVGQGITVAMGNTSITFPNFAALVQAYQGDSDVSVLATPQLLTMNNEEAEINISKNMPYITRQDQTNTGVSATNYSNYDYKDVGIIIKITPHINEDGYIRLKIDQNVSSMDTTSDKFRPTTRKRSAKTTVMLKDGNTLVIGGLIQENGEVGTFKVPLLGDIPLLGWLFKYQRKTSEKTNLFFFVSPRIVRTAAEAATLTSKKTSEIGVLEEGVIRMYDPKRDKARVPKP